MAPIALPTATVQPKAAPVRPAAIAAKGAFVLPAAVAADEVVAAAPAELPASPKRSKLAVGGKSLPVHTKTGGKKDEDKDRDEADPAFSWVAALLAPPSDASPGIALPARGTTTPAPVGNGVTPAAENAKATVPAATLSTETAALAAIAQGQGLPAQQQAAVPNAPTTTPIAPTPPIADPSQAAIEIAAAAAHPDLTGATPAAATRDNGMAVQPKLDLSDTARVASDATVTATASPAIPAPIAPAQPSTAQPAAQVFAEAILAAQPGANAHSAQRKDDPADPAPLALAATTIDSARPGNVHAAVAPQRDALDLTQDKGLRQMIDHIETLRDNADAADTRIRLTPAGLGTVDVAVRKDGDIVHVHFSAEQEATRTLITDAQPRLAQLAEARGIRLGDTSVSGGATDLARQQQQQQRFVGQAAAPARAPRTDFATDTTDADARVA
jgi:flagellar hook-length control protein FliK